MYKKVYVEITNTCNLNCSFCHGHNRPAKKMTIIEFTHVLNQLKNYTEYIYYHLMGEPLTHPLLPDFLRLAKNNGFKSIITTNGTLLKKRGEELLSSGIHKINVSIHSFENGSEEDQTTYLNDIVKFSKLASNKGVIVVFRLWNKGYDQNKNQTTLEVLKQAFTNEWIENARGVKLQNNVFLEWGERFEWPDKAENIKGERFFCYGLKDQFGILCDGTVVPCCLDSDGIINLGNVFETNLDDILTSKRAKLIVDCFQNGKASEDLCKRCGYAQRFIK